MSALVEVENVVHGPGRDDAVTIAQLEAGGEVGALYSAGANRRRGRRDERDDLAALADLDRFAGFNPLQDRAEVVPELADGCALHVQPRC
jgi:hypothetical protein